MAYLSTDYSDPQGRGFRKGIINVPTIARLDNSKSFAKGCVGAFLFNEKEGSEVKNYAVPTKRGNVVGTYQRTYTSAGMGMDINADAGTSLLTYNCGTTDTCDMGLTVTAYTYVDNISNQSCIWKGADAGIGTGGWSVYLGANAGSPTFWTFGNAFSNQMFPTYNCKFSNCWFTGVWYPGVKAQIWVNGVLVSEVANTKITQLRTSTIRYYSGPFGDGTAGGARLYATFMHERVLSGPEIVALHSDYSQFFTWHGKDDKFDLGSYGVTSHKKILDGSPFASKVS